jgi:hypothetical protein
MVRNELLRDHRDLPLILSVIATVRSAAHLSDDEIRDRKTREKVTEGRA